MILWACLFLQPELPPYDPQGCYTENEPRVVVVEFAKMYYPSCEVWFYVQLHAKAGTTYNGGYTHGWCDAENITNLRKVKRGNRP